MTVMFLCSLALCLMITLTVTVLSAQWGIHVRSTRSCYWWCRQMQVVTQLIALNTLWVEKGSCVIVPVTLTNFQNSFTVALSKMSINGSCYVLQLQVTKSVQNVPHLHGHLAAYNWCKHRGLLNLLFYTMQWLYSYGVKANVRINLMQI